ncbi:hypothetical protein Lgra_2862 [Legionella gratiana]|uniref:Peptidase C58 YopT-type domain-containing protein n=1 Tax=Legionella gratiana TaxID=45066 RepID=A0A378J501_9GAMM|nr:hypothetical protein [Legionella gratiana]KTD06085.1 hypothetical protein Lgra_2862 [Legionella gratiana]STX42812.1 Uncharacterised protein [Legionella gratiana]
MFSRFWSRSSKPTYERFTTQRVLLDKYGNGSNEGLCKPLANKYVEMSLKGMEGEWLKKTDFEIYKDAVETENYQYELDQKGQDGRHSAFENLEHEDLLVEENTITNPDNFEKFMGDSDCAIISYRQKGGDAHQVAFRKNKGSCAFFDANHVGGEIKGRCPLVRKFMSNSIRSEIENDSKALIGLLKSSPKV